MVEEGFPYGECFLVTKALFGREKSYDTTSHSVEAILNIALSYVFEIQEGQLSQEREISQLRK